MKKARKKKMAILIGVILIIVGGIVVYFNISYSPSKKQFYTDARALIEKSNVAISNQVFCAEDFASFPKAIQKYMNYCGYIGTTKMSYIKMGFKDVVFLQNRKGAALKIDYTVYNFTDEPNRLALIDSSLFGIPFEGYDYFSNGIGGMKGTIGKLIPLFNQTGAEMNKACLVTFLAECFFAPTMLLQDSITLEEIDEYNVKATISYYAITASGIFTFNEIGEMILFTTNDRAVTSPDGTMEYVKWSAVCEGYQKNENGIMLPTSFQAVWNYDDGDFIYFDGKISNISYN